MKVKMLVNTNYNGFKQKGDIVALPSHIAQRWVNNKLAEFVVEEPVIDIEKLTAKELYDLCVKKNIKVAQRKARVYYLEKLKEE